MTDLPSNVRWQLWIVAFGFFMQSLDTTIVNTATPRWRSLGESPLHMHMVIIAYVLTVAVMLPASGWLADKVGVRNMLLHRHCAVYHRVAVLRPGQYPRPAGDGARALQGVGGAMMVPVGRLTVMAVPRAVYGGDDLRHLARSGRPAAWPGDGRYSGGVCLLALDLPDQPAGRYYRRDCRSDADAELIKMQTRRFDFVGFILLAAGMATLTLALDGQKGLGISSLSLALLVALGITAILWYLWHARANANALFSLNLFGNPTYRLIFGSFCRTHRQRHVAVYDAGIFTDWDGLLAVPRRADDPDGARQHGDEAYCGAGGEPLAIAGCWWPPRSGLALVCLLFMAVALLGWYYILPLVLFCQEIINSMRSSMNTLTLKDLPDELASSGNSLLSMIMQLSMSVGVTVTGLLLGMYGQHHLSADTPVAHQVFLYTYLSMAVIIALPAFYLCQSTE